MKKNKHYGSHFDEFLVEEGLLGETEAVAIKRILAYQIEQAMEERDLSKNNMAKIMHTSRAAVDRLLDEKNTSVTLSTMIKAASALDKKISININ